MKYTFAALLGLGVMLGATADAAPRLGEPALQSEVAAPTATNIYYRRHWGYGYGRPWFHRYYGGYYHRPYWGHRWGYRHYGYRW